MPRILSGASAVTTFLACIILLSPANANGQFWKKLKEKVDKVEERITKKIDQKVDDQIDQQVDKVEAGIDDPSKLGKSESSNGAGASGTTSADPSNPGPGQFFASAAPWISEDSKAVVNTATSSGPAIVVTDGTSHTLYLSACSAQPNTPADIRILGRAATVGRHYHSSPVFNSIRVLGTTSNTFSSLDATGGWVEFTSITPTLWSGKLHMKFKGFVIGKGLREFTLQSPFRAKVTEAGAHRTMCSQNEAAAASASSDLSIMGSEPYGNTPPTSWGPGVGSFDARLSDGRTYTGTAVLFEDMSGQLGLTLCSRTGEGPEDLKVDFYTLPAAKVSKLQPRRFSLRSNDANGAIHAMARADSGYTYLHSRFLESATISFENVSTDTVTGKISARYQVFKGYNKPEIFSLSANFAAKRQGPGGGCRY